MTVQGSGAAEARSLEILGISEAEERTYQWLLSNSGETMSEIAKALAMTPGKTQRLLDSIESKGLTTHTPERPRRYIPVSPDIALRALSLRRKEELQRADGMIRQLQEHAAAQRGNKQEQMVELIISIPAEKQVYEQIQNTAQREVVALVRSPMLVSRLDAPYEHEQFIQRAAQTRGVHYRSIVDVDVLALPGAVHRVQADIKAGEEVRTISHLPFKMVLADRRIAFIPLDLQRTDSPSLLVRSSALLDALCALFELLWKQSVPISFTRTGDFLPGDASSRMPQVFENMVSLMATGLNDKRVAYELNLSMRTYRRRTVELMKSLNARTRFQAGWAAALQQENRHPPVTTSFMSRDQ